MSAGQPETAAAREAIPIMSTDNPLPAVERAEREFWKSIPVGALLRPGAVDWIEYALRNALIQYSGSGGIAKKAPGPALKSGRTKSLGAALKSGWWWQL